MLESPAGLRILKGSLQESLHWLNGHCMPVSSDIFASLILHCCTSKALSEGRQVHAHIIKHGHGRDRFLGNLLLQMYRKCGAMEEAQAVFSKMHGRNVVSWTIMIGASAQHGSCEEALRLFRQMQLEGVRPNRITFLTILSACAKQSALVEGKSFHACIKGLALERDVAVGNALINMYSKCGSLEDAQSMFDRMLQKDVVSWNAMIAAHGRHGNIDDAQRLFDIMPDRSVISWNSMIAAYIQCKHSKKALALFEEMQKEDVMPDKITFISILSACTDLANLHEGERIHRLMRNRFESDVAVNTALLNMYGKCGSLENARCIFCKMTDRNVVSWTAMIAAYAQHGQGKEAFKMFQQMQLKGAIPDKVTFISLLDACASKSSITEGRLVHAHIVDSRFESDVIVGTAIVNMYCKCGSVELANKMFDKMHERNIVSWNAMIAGYVLHEQGNNALQLFQQMQLEGLIPNKSTIISILDACTSQILLAEGRQIHRLVKATEIEQDVVVATSLINFYGKCGKLEDARKMFDSIPEQNMVSCTAMIAVYAKHGQGMDALLLFQDMELQNVIPNNITFVSILSACSCHCLLNEACRYFVSMSQHYGITPTEEHYNCMIDLLGQVGQLDEGEDLIDSMPCQPTLTSWTSLLGACGKFCDLERGQHTAKQIFELDPENAASYVSLSNMYSATSSWEYAFKVRKKMQQKCSDRGLCK